MQMSSLLLALLSVWMCLCAHAHRRQQSSQVPECNPSPVYVFRNDNLTCPDRAVCADVFRTKKNWYGRGPPPCMETRILHNCRCPSANGESTMCPFTNQDHMLMASRRHKAYTCQPACTLPYCSNVRSDPTSMRMIQREPTFGNKNFYRMECRCPRHHRPSTRGGIRPAAYAHSSTWSVRTHQFMTLYRCRTSGSEAFMQDPCPSIEQN